MTMVEFMGYVAAALVFATFCMKTMIPLRIVGIASNVAFLLNAWPAGVVPLFLLHSALLPMNIWRLTQIQALVREVRKSAAGDLPHGRPATVHVAATCYSGRGPLPPWRSSRRDVLYSWRSSPAGGTRQDARTGRHARRNQHVRAVPRAHRHGRLRHRRRFAFDHCRKSDAALLSEPQFRVPRGPADHRAPDRELAPRSIRSPHRMPARAATKLWRRAGRSPTSSARPPCLRRSLDARMRRRRPLRVCGAIAAGDHPARRRLAAGPLPALHGEPRLRGYQLDPRCHLADHRQSSFPAAQGRATGSDPTG